MAKHSVIKTTQLNSPLEAQAVIRPKGSVIKKSLVTGVVLTSLVDAFSILVIYLLVNASAADKSIQLQNGVDLPMASHTTTLEQGVIVRLAKGQYFINDDQVRSRDLPARLYEIQQANLDKGLQTSLVIEAERQADFSKINPILIASSMSGFSKIKFAVVRKGEAL